MREMVAVLDFGSQYAQLIARRIRELGVYCEIVEHDITAKEISRISPKALVLSGGPASVLDEHHPEMDPDILTLNIPMLGICYGMQHIAQVMDGTIEKGRGGEYGPATIDIDNSKGFFADLGHYMDVWMSLGDQVIGLPRDFALLAHTSDCPIAAMGDLKRQIYGVQFHPEVVHTPRGHELLKNFLYSICKCSGGWSMAGFVEDSVSTIRSKVGDANVICGLSGGVDSAVVAALINKAIGDQMTAIFVDNGLLRAGEVEEIEHIFTNEYPLNLDIVDARQMFLNALKGITEPELKRKAIGRTFIDVFYNEADRIGGATFLAQGTLYPDVIESRSAKGGPSATIKSHHNVGGLPPDLKFELIEPLKELFKDEVRLLGKELGLPENLVNRQPFPGPGLAVRILGEVTAENLKILQQADLRVKEELRHYPGYSDIWQSFAVLLPVKTVGVMGDERTYANVVALRIVSSMDGMTADWVKVPYEYLARISSRIINEVKGVNRVVYDISSKPPSTIEWE